MRFNFAYALACLAGSSTLAAAVPVEATEIEVDNLQRRGQIPANMDTTACKQYSLPSSRHSEECRGDINDPRVAQWKFKAGTNCGLGAVNGIIRRATGQKGDDAQCLISFDGKWPGYE
ncbi:hypothetical protein NW767_003305 [Fusarium falciforme]|nr:hypothetical protein NW767_003305 [Fusarium falciforme]